ncbi:conserved exported hypothetical protein [Vibrio coralliirubri]|uniref:hypothetical protein n=1 Tax=Vibrio coralliirubri TaxID=1516159 RepID=UPI000630D6B4|nr:hypothetical protein [Vibrio coralliirubri]CDT76762.1 conserved exported hypothetical protein [Vibrio coralliirubri]
MQISKVATAVALSTGLLFGCNSDGLPIPTDGSTDPGSQPSALTTGYWQISDGNSASISASSNADLPNVYVFQEDGNHKYYDDDDDLGTYTIKDASASTNNYDEEAGTVSFTYYETGSSTLEILDGVFSFDDAGVLSISDESTGINYSGSDQTATDSVQDAISQANEASGINGYVQILDTNFGTGYDGVDKDVGELRLKLSDSSTGATVDSIESGKVTVDLIYQVDEDSKEEVNTSGNNAYVSLYASGTSNTNLHGEIIFNAGEIFYRSTVTDGDGKPQIPDEPVGTYTLGEDLAVEISWANGYYTFKVNDTVYDNSGNGFEAFDKTAVTLVSLKLGDTKNTTHYELNADNFKVYSNDTATDELVFEDNFNSYPNGQVLSGNPYNNNTAEATVIVDGGSTEPEPEPEPDPEPGEVTDDFESYTVGEQIDVANSAYNVPGADSNTIIANVSADFANSGTSSLLLHDNSNTGKPVVSREFSAGPAESGSVSISVYIPEAGYNKSSYLFLGTSDSASSSKRFTEIAFGSTEIKFRNESGDQKTLANYAQDTWIDVTLTWAPNGSDDTYDITIDIDGQEYVSYQDADSAIPLKAENDTGAPTLFAVYVGDTANVDTYSYFDDLNSDLF